jgi:hypothetical protein
MPRKRRPAKRRYAEVNPIRAFAGPKGDGTDCWFRDDAVYPSRQEAAAAWQWCRRDIWARCFRFRVPKAATVYDGIRLASVQHVCWHWNHVVFDLSAALAEISADRGSIERFERADPRGAEQIRDFLAQLRADLQVVEGAARRLAAVPELMGRSYPGTLNTAETYGGVRAAPFGE